MLTLSYRAALIAVALLALLPTAITLAFFDGPASLAASPFSMRMLGIAFFAAMVIVILFIWDGFRAGKESPLRHMIEMSTASPLTVLAPALLILLSVYPSRVFVYLKDAIPTIVPFYLDPWLIPADRWLFLGTDPWRVTHAMLGTEGTILLDKIYIGWFMLIPALAVWICASRDRNFQLRGITTLFFIWIGLGTFGAMALSSCGPVFYQEYFGSDYYAPLMAELRRADALSPLAMLPIAQWLLDMRASGELGTGISAMPSVHVAIAFFAFLLVWEKMRYWWSVSIAGAFCFAIWLGSFHLAWHYAWDGIVSIVAVWGFWKLIGLVEVQPTARADRAPLLAEQQA